MGNHRKRSPVQSVAKAPADTGAASPVGAPGGGLVRFEGEDYYRISSYHLMSPFLMTLATDTDLWMFVTSGGGLTAGRGDPDGSIFPYETVDRLHDGHHHTGPVTLIRVRRTGESPVLWEPFSSICTDRLAIDRNLYKSITGHRLVFEETDRSLGLVFRYRWAACDEFGWVRTATLENRGASPVTVELLDGLRNILPHGVSQALSQGAGNLADAYKTSEVDERTGLAVFSLTAGISDRPEAAEVLRANVAWCAGLTDAAVHLSGEAIDAFRGGRACRDETPLTGRRGNYLVAASLELGPAEYAQWHVAVDAGRSQAQIVDLRERIAAGRDLEWDIESGLTRAGENIRRIVGSADGIQLSGRAEAAAHHFANVLYNSMRGGVFADNHGVESADLADFIRVRNRPTAERRRAFLERLPRSLGVGELLRAARETGDADLSRLCHEYLPIHFGRRHGDPSRPWNRFTIRVRNSDGTRALHYEGNWRDIFQNWEAMCASFPGFIPNVVSKFVNASTVDGFNPYRVTRDGVEWETPDPRDPWSHIGYWGDHQIVYLLKLLESMERYLPGEMEGLLDRDVFSYADVPYRIRPYEDILRSPACTIEYDAALDAAIAARVSEIGTDGRLVPGAGGGVCHVNLLEKLLVPFLSKLSNLVPDGGIWLNTQRPEWNDANNALVGTRRLRRDSLLSEALRRVPGEEPLERGRRSAAGVHRGRHLVPPRPVGPGEGSAASRDRGHRRPRPQERHGRTGPRVLGVQAERVRPRLHRQGETCGRRGCRPLQDGDGRHRPRHQGEPQERRSVQLVRAPRALRRRQGGGCPPPARDAGRSGGRSQLRPSGPRGGRGRAEPPLLLGPVQGGPAELPSLSRQAAAVVPRSERRASGPRLRGAAPSGPPRGRGEVDRREGRLGRDQIPS